MQFTSFALAALSMGSAIAQPLTGLVSLSDATAAIGSAKAVVQEQVTTINTLVKGEITAETVVEVRKSLVTVGQTVNGLVGSTVTLVGVNPDLLSQDQITVVPALLENTHEVFVSVQDLTKVVVTEMQKNSILDVEAELQFVLGGAGVVTQNVVKFVDVAISAKSPVFATISATLGHLKVSVNGLLAPIAAVVVKLIATL